MDCKVYVGNLGNNAAKHELEAAFSKFGPLVNVWIARNPPGFAFVEFEDPRDAEDATKALDGSRLCNVRVRVEMSTGRSKRDRYPSPPRRRRSRNNFLLAHPPLLFLLLPPPPPHHNHHLHLLHTKYRPSHLQRRGG